MCVVACGAKMSHGAYRTFGMIVTHTVARMTNISDVSVAMHFIVLFVSTWIGLGWDCVFESVATAPIEQRKIKTQ